MDLSNFLIESLELYAGNDLDYKKLPDIKNLDEKDKDIANKVIRIFRDKSYVDEIKTVLNKEFELNIVLEKLLDLIGETTGTNRIGAAYIDENNQTLVAETGVYDYGRIFLDDGFTIPLSRTSIKEVIDSKKGRITHDLEAELEKRPKSLQLRLIIKEGLKSNLILPIILGDIVIGVLFFSSRKAYNYSERDLKLGESLASEIAGLLKSTYLIKKIFITMSSSFAKLVSERDGETGEHLDRMAEYSRIIAEGLILHEKPNYRVRQNFVNKIRDHAAIHDIGKIGIPDELLNKAGKFTEEEKKFMEGHTLIGSSIIRQIQEDLKIFNKGFLQIALDIVESHHERWDGKGYPRGLKGEEIPLAARIVSIGDVFDALSSKRVYKDGINFKKTVEIINEGAGSQFDPELVKVFNKVLPKIKIYYDNNRPKE